MLLADMKAIGTFEFGSGISTTNLGVLEMVEQATGKKANVKIVPSMRDYDNDDWRCKNPAPEFVRTKNLADSIREMVEAYEPA